MPKPTYTTIGQALGISKQAVGQAAKKGMPTDSIEAARAWRLANLDAARAKDQRMAVDRPNPPLAQAPASPPGSAGGGAGADDEARPDDSAAYREARTKREQINAQKAQLELDQMRGRLIDVEEAARLAYTSFRAIRDAVLSVPSRIVAEAAAQSDQLQVEQLMDAALVEALGRFDAAALLVDADADDDSDATDP